MNINGLNSLGFTPQSQKSGSGKAASGKSAFQEILGQAEDTKSQDKTQTQDRTQSQDKARLQAMRQAKSPLKNEKPSKDADQNVDSQNPQTSQQETVSENTRGAAGTASDETRVGSEADRVGSGSAKSQNAVGSEVGAIDAQNSAEANALPGQPNIPSLNGPIGERLPEGPNQNVLMGAPGAKVPSGLAAQEDSVDSLTRRVVWNDFLRKMKDELGVSAEEVLGAFTTLSEQDLMAPPAQVADKVVMAMGLNPQDQQVAKQFFTELVSKTKSKSLGEELATSQKQINLTLMSQREMMRKSMQRSIDRLNQNFFMPQGRPEAHKEGMAVPGMIPVTGEEASILGGQLDPMYTSPAPNMQTLTPAQALEMQQGPSVAPQAQTPAQAQKNTVDEMIRSFMSPQTGEAAMAAPQAGAAATGSGSSSATSAAMASSASLGSMLGGMSAGGEGEESEDFLSDASYLQQPIGPESRFAGLAGASTSEFKTELANLNNNQPVAIPELVDRAQLMVHSGGGEMKVTLSPDGLGEVAMRVSVENGKVSVQMITESDEAKKMIERQLSELKSGLSQNHLQIESIKIDTASSLGKQLEQQYQDAQRQMAHQTLEQFRQDHQGWRRSFFETPSSKNYKGQSEAPRDIRAPSNNKAKGARRLDLVA